MKKFNIVSKLSLLSNIIIADNDRYGPNGIMLLLFFTKLIIDNGSAMNDAINMVARRCSIISNSLPGLSSKFANNKFVEK